MKRQSIIQGFPICVVLLIFVVLTSGCVGPTVTTLSAVKLQNSEVAVIKGRYYFTLLSYDCVEVNSIDYRIERTTNLEFPPGRHELLILHSANYLLLVNNFKCAPALLNFEAGHEYKIKLPFLSNRVRIIDVNTGVTIFSETLRSCLGVR
jgi:hypothetical protein